MPASERPCVQHCSQCTYLLAGTSYEQFIRSMHLPAQLAQVDPIVASFCGGAVGVLSTLLVVEVNNAKLQAKTRCVYCEVRAQLLQKPMLNYIRASRLWVIHPLLRCILHVVVMA